MIARERIAVVTPREERREHAERWSRLLAGRAECFLCESPGEENARSADLVVVDEECPDLDAWIQAQTDDGRAPDSIVVVGSSETKAPARSGMRPRGMHVEPTTSSTTASMTRSICGADAPSLGPTACSLAGC